MLLLYKILNCPNVQCHSVSLVQAITQIVNVFFLHVDLIRGDSLECDHRFCQNFVITFLAR